MARPAASKSGRSVALDCLHCPTRGTAEWAVLNDDEMAELNAVKSTRDYQKGEYVYTQGQPCTGVYCIAAGTVAVRRAEPPLPTVLMRLVFTGQILGYRHCLREGGCSTSAKVLEPSTICHVEIAQLQRLLRRSRALQGQLQASLAADLDATEAALAHVAWLPVRSRVARLILELAQHNGSRHAEVMQEVSLPMTRRDMAELLCTRPETLTRTMAAMEADGLLQNAGHRIAIADVPALRREAQPAAV